MEWVLKGEKKKILLKTAALHVLSPTKVTGKKKKKKGAESLHRRPSRHRARALSSGSVPPRTIICAAADNAAVSQPPESVGRLESDRKHRQQRAVVFVQLEQRREGGVEQGAMRNGGWGETHSWSVKPKI